MAKQKKEVGRADLDVWCPKSKRCNRCNAKYSSKVWKCPKCGDVEYRLIRRVPADQPLLFNQL